MGSTPVTSVPVSDRLDAYRAARAVLADDATTEPKRASIEPLRALSIARRSA